MCAGVAELVDALGLGPSAFGVGVRVPSPVPLLSSRKSNILSEGAD